MKQLELKNIQYAYSGGVDIFKGLDFSLTKGQRIGIVGANGSGKTTLFSLMMGFLAPQKGKVCLFGQECQTEKDFVEARRKIGYLFQDPDDQVFCPTVEEDIAFGPLNLGFSPDEARRLTREMMCRFGLDVFAQRMTTKLSWGQKRLVSLAGVLAMTPELLILDEPTASIDDNVIRQITTYLTQSNYSLIVASHDRPFLKALDADIFLLQDGNLGPASLKR